MNLIRLREAVAEAMSVRLDDILSEVVALTQERTLAKSRLVHFAEAYQRILTQTAQIIQDAENGTDYSKGSPEEVRFDAAARIAATCYLMQDQPVADRASTPTDSASQLPE